MKRTVGPWVSRNAVALLALFVALGGTGYAATAINGKLIKNRTITGNKLKNDTLGGAQVREANLAKVPSAARADSAGRATSADTATSAGSAKSADTATSANSANSATHADSANSAMIAGSATSATNAVNAQTAATLGAFGPDAFARASQMEVRGPFETDPTTGTDEDFFSFPEIGFVLRTPRAPNQPANPGLVQAVQDPGTRVLAHFRSSTLDIANEYSTGSSGINWVVNQTGDQDYLEITVVSLTTDFAARIECLADDSVADIPVSCVAFKSKP